MVEEESVRYRTHVTWRQLVEDCPELSSDVLPPWFIAAYGRLGELSARLEHQLRQVLGVALGLDQHTADALFLGASAGALVKSLTQIAGVPTLHGRDWITDAVRWGKAARQAVDARSNVLHRAPGIEWLDHPDHPEYSIQYRVLHRARLNQPYYELPDVEAALVSAIRDLRDLVSEAEINLGERPDPAMNDNDIWESARWS